MFVDQVGCTYTFWWDHHLACSSNSSHLITKDSCMVKDDQSGHIYDFRPLKKLQKSLTTQDKDGNKYSLRICSALNKGTMCYIMGCLNPKKKTEKVDFILIVHTYSFFDVLLFQQYCNQKCDLSTSMLKYFSERYFYRCFIFCCQHG